MSDSTLTLRPPVWALLTAVIIGGFFYIGGKKYERMPMNGPLTINVTADAKKSLSPDIAVLSIGITSGRQETAKKATETIAKSMEKIIDALMKSGVEKKDITTQSFALNPEYDYTTQGQVPRGFQAMQSLMVKVRDLDKAGDSLSAAISAGANQANSIQFIVENPDSIRDALRKEAITKAQEKAAMLAADLGMSVGKMIGFSDSGSVPSPMRMMARGYGYGGGGMDMAMEKSVTLPSGEQEITSTVTITYELR